MGDPTAHSSIEVLLVYNSNSSVSTAIANYYAGKRGITNVLAIVCEDSAFKRANETISLANYIAEIQTPISNYLSSHSGINFIVLTKGIPIIINGGVTGSESQGVTPQDYTPSVDSYLAALDYSTVNGDVKATIVGSGATGKAWVNKYYNARTPFTHAAFGGYLVTRLDAYTQADAMALVDRSLAAKANLRKNPILLDVESDFGLGDKTAQPPYTPSTNITSEESYDKGNADLLHAADILEGNGMTDETVVTNAFVGDKTNLLGYFSWGSNDDHFNNRRYESLHFLPGAIANTYVSSSMYTFIGQYVGFNSINLTGMTTMKARIANANNNNYSYIFQIRLDSPSGQVVGTCSAPPTGGWQSWTTVSCVLAPGVSGVHNIYLTFVPNGYGGNLYNIEWIAFQGVPSVVEAASYNSLSGGEQLENCSEGGQDMSHIADGGYAVYKSINLNSETSFRARVASAGLGGTIKICLGNPNGLIIGTGTVPVTGGWQTWTTITCNLTGASGVHDIYLLFNGEGGYLYNLKWFNFVGGTNVVDAGRLNAISGDAYLEGCSEGGEDLGGIPDGQSHMSDLIANGLTGAEGYVAEPTLDAIVGIAFNIRHYEAGYTLAESFYAGTPYIGWEGTVIGDPLCAPYYGATAPANPTQASSYSGSAGGVAIEDCSEGDLDIGRITNGSYVYYKRINLIGANTFRARVASAGSGGNIEVHLDSPTGATIGTCAVPVNGRWQTWSTVKCNLAGASGTHNIYLVFAGSGGYLFNFEWFAFN